MKDILDGVGATWGNWYWPAFLLTALCAFLGPEIYSLVTDRGPNTLSAWVWRTLQITRNETPNQWNAPDFLTFGIWIVLVVWLTFHFWGGRFT